MFLAMVREELNFQPESRSEVEHNHCGVEIVKVQRVCNPR
jgi:hypothetical protein